MGSPACAAAALAVDGAALVAMRPALKTGKHKPGAGAARRQPSPLARTRGSSLRSCAGAAKETQRCAGTLLRGGRGGRDHKTHRASAFPATFLLLRLLHGGFHTPSVPRSVRGVNLTCLIPSFCLCLLLYLGGDHFAPRNRAVLQKFKHALAGATL